MIAKRITSRKQVSLIPQERIESRIFLLRGIKVMVDSDLADLYGVPTKRLNEQVKRNLKRFPPDFMFQMTKKELENWRSQFATSNKVKMGIRRLPYVFTREGVAMLSSVINSDRAIEVNVEIMRVFIRLRELMISHKDLARKIGDLERKFKDHDQDILLIFKAIKELLEKPEEPKKKGLPIGFHAR